MRSRYGQGSRPREVVLTGGPGVGNAAVFELAERTLLAISEALGVGYRRESFWPSPLKP